MASRQVPAELPAASSTNALVILKGARARLAQGFNTYFDAINQDDQGTASTSGSAVSWSIVGAIGAAAQEAKLAYMVGCYALLDMVDAELGYDTWRCVSQEEVIAAFDKAIERLSSTN